MEVLCECPVCLEEFSLEGAKVPSIFPCGHSFCSSCVESLATDSKGGDATCPSCRAAVKTDGGFTKNFALLELLRNLHAVKDKARDDKEEFVDRTPEDSKIQRVEDKTELENEKKKEKEISYKSWVKGKARIKSPNLPKGTCLRHNAMGCVLVDKNEMGLIRYYSVGVYCHVCKYMLTKDEATYRTGYCNACWDIQPPKCNHCSKALSPAEFRFGKLCCNPCWDKVSTTLCKSCSRGLTPTELAYKTGLCNNCYNAGCK